MLNLLLFLGTEVIEPGVETEFRVSPGDDLVEEPPFCLNEIRCSVGRHSELLRNDKSQEEWMSQTVRDINFN